MHSPPSAQGRAGIALVLVLFALLVWYGLWRTERRVVESTGALSHADPALEVVPDRHGNEILVNFKAKVDDRPKPAENKTKHVWPSAPELMKDHTFIVFLSDWTPAVDEFCLESWLGQGASVVLVVFCSDLETELRGSLEARFPVRVVLADPLIKLTSGFVELINGLSIETPWITFLEQGTVLPTSHGLSFKALIVQEKASFVSGRSIGCMIPKDLTRFDVLGRENPIDLLSIHMSFVCNALGDTLGFNFLSIESSMLERILSNQESLRPVRIFNTTSQAWKVQLVLPHKEDGIIATSELPLFRFSRESVLQKAVQDYSDASKRDVEIMCRKPWSRIQKPDEDAPKSLLKEILECLKIDKKDFRNTCAAARNGYTAKIAKQTKAGFAGDFVIEYEDLRQYSRTNQKRLQEVYRMSLCSTPRTVKDNYMISKQALGRHWAKPESLHACITNCWIGGTGSRTMGFAIAYNLSLELGFPLFFQRLGNDYEHKVYDRMVDDIGPLYEKRPIFNPKRCDYMFRGWDNSCLYRASYRWRSYLHFDLYNDIVYRFLEDNYSPRLRSIADLAAQQLKEKYPGHQVVSVYIRLEDQMGGRKDVRFWRRLELSDFRFLMKHFEKRNPKTVYLVTGDQGAYKLEDQPNVIMAEQYMKQLFGGSRNDSNRLERQFAAMDWSSRYKLRVGIQYSNNYYMQLAFHQLNGNTEGIEYADAFSMRIFNYNNEILHDFEDPAFNSTRWTFTQSPYNQPRVPEEYNITRECFKRSIFGTTLVDRWRGQLNKPCDLEMFDEILY